MRTRSRPLKAALRRLRDGLRAGLLRLGWGDPLLPPRSRMRVGSGDFLETGEEFFRYFVELAGLRPDEAVLDVGCGIGRMAVPLTRYLQPPGRYLGFDPVADGIDWCRRSITPRFPHFAFVRTDVRNANYNPAGAVEVPAFRFPGADGSFDFAFLTSVFTHMLPPEVDHYLGELHRVLRPGGRCLMTAFLLDDTARALLASGRGKPRFDHALTDCWVADPARPEDAVAFDAGWFVRLLEARGFSLAGPVRPGTWSGRDGLSRQDLLVAKRTNRRTITSRPSTAGERSGTL